jgi:hypothetical protein
MTDQTIIVTMTQERVAIETAHVSCERLLVQFRRELAAVEARSAVFAAAGVPADAAALRRSDRAGADGAAAAAQCRAAAEGQGRSCTYPTGAAAGL